MLEGALSHIVIVKCGLTIEIVSRIMEEQHLGGENKTSQHFFIKRLFAASISKPIFFSFYYLNFVLFSVTQEMMLFLIN